MVTQQSKESDQLTLPSNHLSWLSLPGLQASPPSGRGGVQKELMGKSATGDVTRSVAAADLSEAEWFGLYQRALWWFMPAELWRIGRNLCQTTLDAPTCFWDSFQEEISLKEHRLPLPCGVLVTEGVTQHFISVGVFLNYFLKQFFKVICLCKFGQLEKQIPPSLETHVSRATKAN